jgi:peptidoglycan/xylan/chitin deacetylase (PgdA/CDA1 family)
MDTDIQSKWNPLRQRTSRQLFEETLVLAGKYFNFVSLDEAQAMLQGQIPLKRNSCVITFDDGQLNNVKLALPILRKYKIPVVLYLTTAGLDRPKPFWFDRLDYVIQQPGLHGQIIEVGNRKIMVDQSSREGMASSLAQLTKSLKEEYISDISFQNAVEDVFTKLEKASGKSLVDVFDGDLWSSLMSEQDVLDCMEENNVTIGSHTINHVRLPLADGDELVTEVTESKKILERLMQSPCYHFCYPNGDWDSKSIRAVEEAGYVTAVTTDPGCNQVGDNLFRLKRYSFPETGTPIRALFSIAGLLHFVSTVRYG